MRKQKKLRIQCGTGIVEKKNCEKIYIDGNDDAASLDEDNLSDGESIFDEVIRNNEESDHH